MGEGESSDDGGSYFEEVGAVLKLGLPMTLAQILGYLPTAVMLVGIRNVPIQGVTGGAGMGVMFQNLVGVSTIIGLGSGLGPLVAQSYGASEFRRCGDLLQRQLLIHACLLLPVGALFLAAEPVLLLLGQPPATAALAGRY